ncbi:MAG: hypothetical protein RI886_1283 [Pseudomonadota bacterium]|jgi:hypothetical protein
MSEFGFYSFSESFKPGIDFNTPDEALTISVVIPIVSNVSINIEKIAFANSSISIDSDTSIVARRIVYAQSVIVADGATLTLGTRIKLASISIEIDSNAVVNSKKIAFASTTTAVDSNLVVSAKRFALASVAIGSNSNTVVSIIKTAKAAISITPLSNLSASAIRITNIALNISGNVNLTIVGKISLATARIVINNLGSVTARAVKFIAGNIISASDLSEIRTVLLIDDKPITNHNRKLGVSVDPVFVENINWNNRKARYYRSSSRPARKTFSLSWSYVPNSQSHTVDGKRGRDYLREIAGKPQHHVLKIINMDENGTTPYTETSYNVLVKDYSETLIRRDLVDDIYFWDCSISLEEV